MKGLARVFSFAASLVTFACQNSPQSPPPVANTTPAELTDSKAIEALAPLNRFDGESFSLSWSTPDPVAIGQTGQGQLVLTAKPPFKCNQEYPFKLKLSARGLEPAKTEVTKADMQVSHERVVIPVTFTAARPGEAVLDAMLAFSVCTDDKCLIERQSMRLGAEVVASK
jgi:hypothetical protein